MSHKLLFLGYLPDDGVGKKLGWNDILLNASSAPGAPLMISKQEGVKE